jgi:hypothetical protein
MFKAVFGNNELAQTALTSARSVFERTIREQPDYPQAWSYLGLTDAMLGRCDDAVREGKRACEGLPLEKGSWTGASFVDYLGNDLCLVRTETGGVGATGDIGQTARKAFHCSRR